MNTLREDIRAKFPLVPICTALVGCNNQIIYSEENQKLVILQGFNKLKIIPQLHQNLIYLRKQKNRDKYLFAK